MSKIRIFHIGGEHAVQIADSLGNVWPPLESIGGAEETPYLDLDLAGGVQITAQVIPPAVEFKESEPAAPIDQTERTPDELRDAHAATEQAAMELRHHEGVEAARDARATETALRDADYPEDEKPRPFEE